MISKNLPPISVTIITKNEEANIKAAIESVSWADEIVVVDSGSTDKTLKIASQCGAKTLSNPWEGYGQQKNFAQNFASHNWILNIDADERISLDLKIEILDSIFKNINLGEPISGYFIPRKTYYLNRWIAHSGWYPNYLIRLYNKKHCTWSEPPIHEEVKVAGKTQKLESAILHYSFPTISTQIVRNIRYAQEGALTLEKKNENFLVLKAITKPFWKFLSIFFLKKGFLDGLAGLIIAINSAHSIFLKYIFYIEKKLAKTEKAPNENTHYR